ncbi:MAG TPA: phosphoglycolate phosphatase [Rhodanobacter sp.]|jgi:2-phosphoglycolate phosphatase
MKTRPDDIRGVFFDLDGTLLDSAPDLYVALQTQCAEEGVPVPPYAAVRRVVSRGATAVLRCAFGARGEAALAQLVPRYLALYQAVMAQQTQAFAGVDELLARIEARGWAWGIVTNKAGFLADELVRRVGWAERASAVVAGDTLAVKKPDPAPVALACARAGVAACHAVFVGDDSRDIQAGAAAGLVTVAAAWGYLDGGDPHTWGADVVLDTPTQLTAWLGLATVPA